MTDLTEAVLKKALERMDRARDILTHGNPTPNCNWGLLDTEDLRALLAEPATPPDPVRIDPAPVYALLRRSLAQMGKWQRKYGDHNPQWLPPDGDVKLAEDIDTMLNQIPAAPQAEPSDVEIKVLHDSNTCLSPIPGRKNAYALDPIKFARAILALRPAPVAEPAASDAIDNRLCTCHPDERPAKCQKKYALSECLAASAPPQPVAQGDYPPLPEPDSWVHFHKQFGEEKMRAFVDADRAARSNLQVGGDVPLSEDDAAAHMFPSDLEKFKFGEHTATAFSIKVGNPDETSVPLFTLEQLRAAAPSSTGSEKL